MKRKHLRKHSICFAYLKVHYRSPSGKSDRVLNENIIYLNSSLNKNEWQMLNPKNCT